MFPQDATTISLYLLRWTHFLAGITWIGMLYFFNLVNGQFMKELDAPTKSKVVPNLMPKALFWFRWGAMVTVIVGLTYHLKTMSTSSEYDGNVLRFNQVFWWWSLAVLATFVIESFLLKPAQGPLTNGRVLFVVLLLLVAVMTVVVWKIHTAAGASWRILSISLGGGLGIIMFMNVWMIIWPLQKKIIAATRAQAEAGTAPPAEMPRWARRAFLASRTNTWLSIPMLGFMAAASHFPISLGH